MKVLVACEFSGIVRDAFRARGHDAISCDILPTESPGPHYQGYLEDFIGSGEEWDLIIAHPPCTYLSNAGIRWFNEDSYGEKARQRKINRQYAMAFVKMIANRNCPKIAIENPRIPKQPLEKT